MCNAHNHRIDCRCGWGGSSGIMSYSFSYPPGELAILRSFAANQYLKSNQSLTRPNYKCKWCKQPVYFFQASNGGKVLFDSLGQPWPIHNCLGIQYKRCKAKLNISTEEWIQLHSLSAAPISELNKSLYCGLLYETTDKQFEVSILLMADDSIMIRDIYLNKSNFLQTSENIETLIIFDDGRYLLSNSRLVDKVPFSLQDLSSKKPFVHQPKLI